MNGNEYVKNAVKTESRDFQAIGSRMQTNWMTLLSQLHNAITAGQRMDDVKKLAFYGKTPKDRAAWDGPLCSTQETLSKLTDSETIRLLHGAIGIFTEAGEMLEQLGNHIFRGEILDKVNMAEEMGDTFWYLAILSDTLGAPMEGIMGRNIEKLKARYGDKFTEERANNRDLAVEREILEKHE